MAGGFETACMSRPYGTGKPPLPRQSRASALHPSSTATALQAVGLRAELALRSPPRALITSRSADCGQRPGCENQPLSSPRPPSSPGWESDALWKAGHHHPPSAFPQGLENPSGFSHSSPATTTSDITTHPLTSYRGTRLEPRGASGPPPGVPAGRCSPPPPARRAPRARRGGVPALADRQRPQPHSLPPDALQPRPRGGAGSQPTGSASVLQCMTPASEGTQNGR